MFGTFRHSRSLLKLIQKYLQACACQTKWSPYNLFRTCRHSRSLLKIIQRYYKLLKIQKYVWDLCKFARLSRASIQKKVWDLQALQESFESNTKILQASKNSDICLGPPGLLKIIQKYYKLARHYEASKNSEFCLGPPGTPRVIWKLYKNIVYSLPNILELRTSRHSRSLLKFIQKCFKTCQTF